MCASPVEVLSGLLESPYSWVGRWGQLGDFVDRESLLNMIRPRGTMHISRRFSRRRKGGEGRQIAAILLFSCASP